MRDVAIGSIDSDQPSLDLNPRTFAVIPVETRLTSSVVYPFLFMLISASRSKRGVQKVDPSLPAFPAHTGRSPVGAISEENFTITPVEARLICCSRYSLLPYR